MSSTFHSGTSLFLFWRGASIIFGALTGLEMVAVGAASARLRGCTSFVALPEDVPHNHFTRPSCSDSMTPPSFVLQPSQHKASPY